jgi:ubiquitin C-terminal hydrolase
MGNKKKDHVHIPRVLTMPEDTHVFDNPQTYKLCAMGCHQGCQYGGHYYAAIMSDADASADANAEHVTIVNDEIVSSHAKHALHEPYMLFYFKT